MLEELKPGTKFVRVSTTPHTEHQHVIPIGEVIEFVKPHGKWAECKCKKTESGVAVIHESILRADFTFA